MCNKRCLAALVALAVTIGLMAGCARTPSTPAPAPSPWPLTVKDKSGQEVTIRARPERVVSMAPNLTEILFALGLDQAVVGRTSFCNYPPAAASMPSVGDEWSPNFEQIVALKPDLVLAVGTAESKIVVECRKLGLTTVVTQSATIEEVLDDIELVGMVTGAQERATSLAGDLRRRYEAVRQQAAGVTVKPKVFWVIDTSLWTVGPGTFLDHLTTAAGGVNVAGSQDQPYLQYSMEALLAADPDAIIFALPRSEYEQMQALPGWNTLRAVKEGRVLFPDPDVVSRPGPRIVDGLELVARGLHPGLFGGK